jgi:hypothetical protein
VALTFSNRFNNKDWTGDNLSLNNTNRTNPTPAYKARSKDVVDFANSSKD